MRVRPLRVLEAADRVGLVYGRPYPLLLTSGVAVPSQGAFMAVVLPVECKAYLPHESRVSLALQKKYAAQVTGLAVYREFFADSRAAYLGLDAAMARVSVLAEEDRLDLSAARQSLREVKFALEPPAVRTEAEYLTMISDAAARKGALEVERV